MNYFMQGIYTYMPETNHVLGYTVLQALCSYCSWSIQV
jgi:hypothetical protein